MARFRLNLKASMLAQTHIQDCVLCCSRSHAKNCVLRSHLHTQMCRIRTRTRRAQQFSILVLLPTFCFARHTILLRSCALQQDTYHAGCQATISSAAPEHDLVDADEAAASAHGEGDAPHQRKAGAVSVKSYLLTPATTRKYCT